MTGDEERERHSMAGFLRHVLTYENAQPGRYGTLTADRSVGPFYLPGVGGCDPLRPALVAPRRGISFAPRSTVPRRAVRRGQRVSDRNLLAGPRL